MFGDDEIEIGGNDTEQNTESGDDNASGGEVDRKPKSKPEYKIGELKEAKPFPFGSSELLRAIDTNGKVYWNIKRVNDFLTEHNIPNFRLQQSKHKDKKIKFSGTGDRTPIFTTLDVIDTALRGKKDEFGNIERLLAFLTKHNTDTPIAEAPQKTQPKETKKKTEEAPKPAPQKRKMQVREEEEEEVKVDGFSITEMEKYLRNDDTGRSLHNYYKTKAFKKLKEAVDNFKEAAKYEKK